MKTTLHQKLAARFNQTDLSAILEVANEALANPVTLSWIGGKMDLSDEEMNRLRVKLDNFLNS